jgi:membrane-bound lytic murein transglycosylase B
VILILRAKLASEQRSSDEYGAVQAGYRRRVDSVHVDDRQSEGCAVRQHSGWFRGVEKRNSLVKQTREALAPPWRARAGYQPGEANFGAIQAWNAAPVYEQAIAVIADR